MNTPSTSPKPHEKYPLPHQEDEIEYVDEFADETPLEEDPWDDSEKPGVVSKPIHLPALPEGLDPRKSKAPDDLPARPERTLLASRQVAAQQRRRRKELLRKAQMQIRLSHSEKWVPASLKSNMGETNSSSMKTAKNLGRISPGKEEKKPGSLLPVPVSTPKPAGLRSSPAFSNQPNSIKLSGISFRFRGPGVGADHHANINSPVNRTKEKKVLNPVVQQNKIHQPDAIKALPETGAAHQKTKPESPRTLLSDVISAPTNFPPFSVVFGICEDGLPLVHSLADPVPGSFLMAGDDSFANRKFLQMVVESVVKLNAPESISICLISRRADRFPVMDRSVEVFAPEDQSTYFMLSERFSEVEKILAGEEQPKLKLMVIDQLELVLEQMADSGLAFFRWLIRRGSEGGLVTIASFTTSQTKNLDLKTLRAFDAVIFGKTRKEEIVKAISTFSPALVSALETGEEILFPAEGENPLRVHLPSLEDDIVQEV